VGAKPDGTYDRVWFEGLLPPDEVTFEAGVFLLTKARAQALKKGKKAEPEGPITEPETPPGPSTEVSPQPPVGPEGPRQRRLRLVGTVPPEVWNRLGTRILPKLSTGSDLKIGVDFSMTLESDLAQSLEPELRQILQDLGLADRIEIEDVEKRE